MIGENVALNESESDKNIIAYYDIIHDINLLFSNQYNDSFNLFDLNHMQLNKNNNTNGKMKENEVKLQSYIDNFIAKCEKIDLTEE